VNPEDQYWAASHDFEQPAKGTKMWDIQDFVQHVSAFFQRWHIEGYQSSIINKPLQDQRKYSIILPIRFLIAYLEYWNKITCVRILNGRWIKIYVDCNIIS
jgi:hypothetical protein